MPEFGEGAGRYLSDLIHSIQEEFDRLPPVPVMAKAIKEFDPTPEQIRDWTGKCADAVAKVAVDFMHVVREAGKPSNDAVPDHMDIPDDLSDLE